MLQVNYTPIPAGWNPSSGLCKALIHVSFSKTETINGKEIPVKIHFDDYPTINKYMHAAIGKTLSLKALAGATATNLPDTTIPKTVVNYWNLFDYNAEGQLRAFFVDKTTLDNALANAKRRKAENDAAIETLRALQEKELNIDTITRINLKMYEGLIQDMVAAIAKLKPETDKIAASDATVKYINEYVKRKEEYEAKKAELITATAMRKKYFAANDDELAALMLEANTIDQTNKMLTDFKKDIFIPGSQDNAVNYIKEKLLGNDAPKNPSPDNKGYTNEIEWKEPLSLSDVLGYFSAYPVFQENLGLLYTVQFPKASLSTETILQVASANLDNSIISANYPKVQFEMSDGGYFYPAPRDKNKDKYKKSYLDLTRKNPADNSDLYALLQNSYEEISYRNSPDTVSSGKSSDYTSGFFLVQSDAKSELDAPDEKPDVYHLEDLLHGYRVDVLRVGLSSWKSLHQRDYHFTFKNNLPIHGEDEGLITSNSATKAFQLVTVTNTRLPTPTDMNVLELAIGSYDFSVVVSGGVNPINLHLEVKEGPTAISSFTSTDTENLTTATLVIFKPSAPIDRKSTAGFIQTINNGLVAQAVAFTHRSIQCDTVGRLYYKGIADAKGKYDPNSEVASYLPSSLICHINGYSLSIPKYMGQKLTDFFKVAQRNLNPIGIEAFMRDENIRLDIKGHAGSLPIIRIGDVYKVRCRLVFIGGVSLPAEDKNETYSLTQTLKRQDPILAPKLLLPIEYKQKPADPTKFDFSSYKKLGDTESRIVLRQSENSSYAPTATRLIAPPSVTWQLAEWLKMMDNKNNLPEPTIMNRAKTTKMPIYSSDGMGVRNGVGVVQWVPGSGKFDSYGTPTTKVPYITDSMASYFLIMPVKIHSQVLVNVRDLSQKDTIDKSVRDANASILKNLQVTFTNEFVGKKLRFWGNLSPADRKADVTLPLWTLNVVAGDSIGVSIDINSRIIKITVAEGDDVEFAIRCYTDDDRQLDTLYYLKPELKDQVKQGDHPDSLSVVLAENRFRVIYALQQPTPQHLGAIPVPGSNEIQQFNPLRYSIHPEDVVLEQGILFRGRTCGEINLMAAWEEIIDDVKDVEGNDGSPIRIVHHYKKVFSYFDPGYYSIGVRNDGHFIFPPQKIASPLVIEDNEEPGVADLYAANKGLAQKRLFADVQGNNLRFRHELGSSKYHAIQYMMTGRSRFADYYPKVNDLDFSSFDTPWFKTKAGGFEFALRATKAPTIPQVACMVPLFETIHPGDSKFITQKSFKGIRVYLKRPWFSSGFGEQLAVITEAVAPGVPEDDYSAFVSLYGKDITTAGSQPTLPQYLNTINIQDDTYLLPGTGEAPLKVKTAVFPVYYDKTKDLWFADVDMKVTDQDGSYCPFIRLVLSRFQKLAEKDVELSVPVACDFMQVFPDRTLSIIRDTITIDAPAIKKSANTPMSEVRYWSLKKENQLRRENAGVFVDEPSLLSPPQKAAYDAQSGQFSFKYGVDDKSLLIREYELFSNTADTADTIDFARRRLLYSHIITLPR